MNHNMSFELVPADESDFKTILSLEERSFPPCDRMSADDLTDFYRRFPKGLYLLKSSDKFAGYVLFTFEVPGEAYLESVAIEPDFRGQGAGGFVLRWAKLHFRAKGIKKLHLHVRKGNEGAVALYEKEGFVLTGTDPSFYDDGEPALLYDLPLKS